MLPVKVGLPAFRLFNKILNFKRDDHLSDFFRSQLLLIMKIWALYLIQHFIMVDIFYANQSESNILSLPHVKMSVQEINQLTLTSEQWKLPAWVLQFHFSLVKVNWLISRRHFARISMVHTKTWILIGWHNKCLP